MAGQNLERREMLRALSIAAGASHFPGFVNWAFADPEAKRESGALLKPVEPQPAPANQYKPQFFTKDEYEIVSSLSELIIPTDGTPGAKEAGASEFIDFMVFSDPGLQYRFRYGVGWIDAHARYLFGRRFLEITLEQQTEMLTHLAYKDRHRAGEEDGRNFFQLVREYTVIGFYTSRVGLEEIGYPGLKQYWREAPGCPHLEDPEHKNLPPPRD
ncbi:MAG TPA: gluconate 2-dehydrogenase subunit 3 family protein [Blastocatellia bacterium]|nr:gluconate 2-dehydrogenase subunit 3 family protein [Blastocatellia bacterium]